MKKPLLIIVNGLPGTGKTTLSQRLAADLQLPVFSRDGIYETLYDALDCQNNGCPPLLGTTSFTFLYSIAGSLLAANKSLIIEGFFGRPELRTAEFRRLQQAHDFEPLQILCKADGTVLLKRFLTRVEKVERHSGHQDLVWLEQNRERLLQGQLTPLALDGSVVEVDTTTPASFAYADLLQQIQTAFNNTPTR